MYLCCKSVEQPVVTTVLHIQPAIFSSWHWMQYTRMFPTSSRADRKWRSVLALSALSEPHCQIITTTLPGTVFTLLFMTLLNTMSTPRLLLTRELRGLLRVPVMLGQSMLDKDTLVFWLGADINCLETGQCSGHGLHTGRRAVNMAV